MSDMKFKRAAALLAFVLLIAACGTAADQVASETSEPTSSTSSEPLTSTAPAIEPDQQVEIEEEEPALPATSANPPSPGVAMPADCPPDAACSQGFVLDGQLYEPHGNRT